MQEWVNNVSVALPEYRDKLRDLIIPRTRGMVLWSDPLNRRLYWATSGSSAPVQVLVSRLIIELIRHGFCTYS